MNSSGWPLILVLHTYIFLYTDLVTTVDGQNADMEHETELIKKIILNNVDYVKEARPASSYNSSTDIMMVPRFLRIEDINEVQNAFTATLILIQVWQDTRLAWNTTEYGGINYVHVPASKLWLPDIVPYNTATHIEQNPLYDETAGVSSGGYVEWGPMITISAECPMDVSDFPFDTQTCTMMFGSWLQENNKLRLKFPRTTATERDILLTDTNLPFARHAAWDILDDKVKAKIEDIKYGNSEFSVLSMTANVKRRGSFYKYLAIGPGALLGFLVPLLFLLPARSQEKNTFGILLFLGLILLITVLADSTPINHANTPRIGIFYLVTMVLVILSLLLSVIVSNLSFRGASRSPLPNWMHRLFLQEGILRKLLCMSTSSPMKSIYGDFQSPEDIAKTQEDTANGQVMGPVESKSEVTTYLRFICAKLTADDEYRNVNQDWTEVARVLDRILFLIFFIVYFVTALLLLT